MLSDLHWMPAGERSRPSFKISVHHRVLRMALRAAGGASSRRPGTCGVVTARHDRDGAVSRHSAWLAQHRRQLTPRRRDAERVREPVVWDVDRGVIERDLTILQGLVQGDTHHTIGEKLCLHERQTGDLIRDLTYRFDARSPFDLIRVATEEGYIW